MKRLPTLAVLGLLGGLVACGGDGPHGPVADSGGTRVTTEGSQPQPSTTAGSAPQTSATPSAMATRVGEPCTTDGAIGYMDGGVVICDGGSTRYALPADLPAAPAGGYTTAPDWYPSLESLFGQPDNAGDSAACAPSDVVFSSPVVPNEALAPSIPHGMMIGDHVTPIDHMYLGLQSLSKPQAELTDADYVPVTAPADGTIVELSSLGSTSAHRVVIMHGCNVVSVYMVLNKVTGVLADYADDVETDHYVRLSLPVKAGDEFGQQRETPLDFNVFDGTSWLPGFVNPYSYAMGEPWKPYTVDPLPFFTDELRAPIEASLQRTTEPRWGKVDPDVAGSAAGNWFLDGTIGYMGWPTDEVAAATTMIPGGAVPGKNTYSYGHLSLSPHWVDTTQWVFSAGWWADPNGDPHQGLLVVGAGQPAPDSLTAASGPVAYALADLQIVDPPGATPKVPGTAAPDPVGYTVTAGQPQGWVLVEVVDDATLHIEVVTDPTAPAPTSFTDAMRSYHR